MITVNMKVVNLASKPTHRRGAEDAELTQSVEAHSLRPLYALCASAVSTL